MEFRYFYIVRNSQTGFDIGIFSSFEEAEKKVIELETEDLKKNDYCPYFYEIIDDFEVVEYECSQVAEW
jgi:hypothetical protein